MLWILSALGHVVRAVRCSEKLRLRSTAESAYLLDCIKGSGHGKCFRARVLGEDGPTQKRLARD